MSVLEEFIMEPCGFLLLTEFLQSCSSVKKHHNSISLPIKLANFMHVHRHPKPTNIILLTIYCHHINTPQIRKPVLGLDFKVVITKKFPAVCLLYCCFGSMLIRQAPSM